MSLNNAFQKTLLYIYNEDGKYTSANLSLIPLMIIIGCTILLYIKYNKHKSEKSSESFDGNEILSVLGVVAMVIGIVWLAGDVKFAIEATKIANGITLLTVEKVLPPLILIGFGLYYGFLFKKYGRT